MAAITIFRIFALTIGLFLGLLPFVPIASTHAAGPKSVLDGAHGNREILPKTCRACHRGMIMVVDEEDVCLDCHGSAQKQEQMVTRGYLKISGGAQLADIEAELRKPYSHPVLSVSGVHQRNEALPEEVTNAVRHSECVDCHDPHVAEKGNPFRGLLGKRVGNFITDIAQEYELCYKCHAESANLPIRSTNKHAEFKTTNPSFHPVEDEGANTFVISLKDPYVARKQKAWEISIISCRDCHGSDDPDGPGGPHGSNYRGLLTENYEMEDSRPESEFTYALCYKCHDRASILANESFPYHALHIEGNRATNQPGTTCFTCHDAHGSTQYQFLIRFNEEVVEPTVEGKLEFKAQGTATRHGSCTLVCHGVEHNPKSY